MLQQRMIRLGFAALLALSLIGWDTPSLSNPAQAQGPATLVAGCKPIRPAHGMVLLVMLDM